MSARAARGWLVAALVLAVGLLLASITMVVTQLDAGTSSPGSGWSSSGAPFTRSGPGMMDSPQWRSGMHDGPGAWMRDRDHDRMMDGRDWADDCRELMRGWTDR